MTAWEGARPEPSAPTCLPDLLDEQARRRPDAPAVVSGDHRLSYRQLVRHSTELAGYLAALGVAADDRIGLFAEPSTDLLVGVWGILFAGAAYLPLSPEYPAERLRYMLTDSDTKVVVAQAGLADRLAALVPAGTTIVTRADATGHPAPRTRPAAHDLAYVIYTSGSTGKPKGVLIEHRSIVSQLRWLAAEYGLNDERTVLQKTPMSFDAAQWEILAPACGATVVVGGPGSHRDAERLIDTIRAHDVTTLQCVPTLLQALLDTDELHTCKSLTQLFTGGEALSRSLARRFLDAVPWCELVNLYGPTECTINSSAYTVDRAALGSGPNAVSIGTPVHATEYHILRPDQSEVDTGEVGELYIGGVQVARGYLHRPELTAERFVANPFGPGTLFRTGDLASWNADGAVEFVGRADNQVKLRGFRVELDEIRLAIETHDWVRHAAVIVKTDRRTGFQNLIACVELNPKEAALMDQGNHGAHHQSKASRLQVRAQLSNAGTRDQAELDGRPTIELPGREATEAQRRQAFARKTYRFYEGGEVTKADILRLLAPRTADATPRQLRDLSFAEFGEILRWFGPHRSAERLLPKYGYASPGSLYATQLYLDVNGVGGLRPGIYYYHPADHRLVLITATAPAAEPRVTVHFVGKKRAIEPVYRNNIREVLEIETGHLVGLFEEILPGYGLGITEAPYTPATKDSLDVADEDYYLGSFDLVPYAGVRADDELDVYVQAHRGKVADLPTGQYAYADGRLEWISPDLVLRRDVIAINQAVYDRASIGITVISRVGPEWRRYVDLGRKLQRLSTNPVHLGFMSSGYSSATGDDLPSAKRIDGILRGLGRPTGPSYFFVGGKVSAEQRRHEGMHEDAVHLRGPAELIRDDLADFLPDYMIPNKVVLLDELPTTANGKIDLHALAASELTDVDTPDRPFVAPRTSVERRIAELWRHAMKRDTVSVQDDFFAVGGNSLIAVGLVNRINREFAATLPLQVLFECPTVELLARRVTESGSAAARASRLVPLQPNGSGLPVYCWPGLGGYPMSLRLLAGTLGPDRPGYGVQAYGINEGETPYATIREMAARDVAEIRRHQPDGPYTLWGYSFGARVAFEAAYQLERAGAEVAHLFLIAPGSPRLDAAISNAERSDAAVSNTAASNTAASNTAASNTVTSNPERTATYDNPAYVTMLFSVFARTISGPLLAECLAVARDDASFVEFVTAHFPDLDADLVRRIIRVVGRTFEFDYTFRELTERRVDAPITIFKARGDDYSFLEGRSGYSRTPPTVVQLDADHYGLLRAPGIDELATAIRRRLDPRKGIVMPHVNIKHFPVPLSAGQQAELVSAVTKAMTTAFGCEEGAVSIAIEPVAEEIWYEQVYFPEIVGRKHILGKVPNYGPAAN